MRSDMRPDLPPNPVPASAASHADPRSLPRWISLITGAWLVVSVFVWPHADAERTNTWVTGVVIVTIASLALYAPALRYLNAAAALWLLVSTLAIEHATRATLWHDGILALVVLGGSLARGRDRAAREKASGLPSERVQHHGA